MQKGIGKLKWMIALQFFYVIANSEPSQHLKELKATFPYGLLTDDYGILTKDDMNINACLAEPVPFNLNSISYQYWQCFETKKIKTKCERGKAPDEREGVVGLVELDISINNVAHDYIERRYWPIKECKDLIRDIKKILKGTTHACISGSFIRKNGSKNKEEMSWIFERIKTKKGCEGRDCDFTKEFKKNNC